MGSGFSLRLKGMFLGKSFAIAKTCWPWEGQSLPRQWRNRCQSIKNTKNKEILLMYVMTLHVLAGPSESSNWRRILFITILVISPMTFRIPWVANDNKNKNQPGSSRKKGCACSCISKSSKNKSIDISIISQKPRKEVGGRGHPSIVKDAINKS